LWHTCVTTHLLALSDWTHDGVTSLLLYGLDVRLVVIANNAYGKPENNS
jgi:hypothetical protein